MNGVLVGRAVRRAASDDQLRAEFCLQVADLPAEGWLRRVQPLLGGVREAALLGDRDELAQVAEFHACDAFEVWHGAYKVFFFPASAT